MRMCVAPCGGCTVARGACFALPAVGCALPSLCAGPSWGPQRDRYPVASAQRCVCTYRSCVAVLRLQVSELVELVELSSWSSWGSWSPRNLELVELLQPSAVRCSSPCTGPRRGAQSDEFSVASVQLCFCTSFFSSLRCGFRARGFPTSLHCPARDLLVRWAVSFSW